MHMADSLISPAVGTIMWGISAGLIGYCSKKIKTTMDDRKIPLMGVLGAFIFAAQMINFSIPGTGSSGHIVGGVILAAILGPYASFIVIASVLVIQSLFFADGGVLALGCNMFNMGFFPAFIAYPLIFKTIISNTTNTRRLWLASMAASIVGLQLGALAVVTEVVASGISSLPFNSFLLMMQPIHLAIGIAEGIVTAIVITFAWKNRPDIMNIAKHPTFLGNESIKGVLIAFIAVAILTGGGLSWFASTHPDGLEWSVFKTSGQETVNTKDYGIHKLSANIQEKTALFPDYECRTSTDNANSPEAWPAINPGTTLSGLIGGILTLLLALSAGYAMRTKKTS